MPEKVFSAALQKSVRIGRWDTQMVQEAARRARAGAVPVRDAQVLLLGTDVEGWRPAREALLRMLAGRPELASSVLATHTQVSALPAVRTVEGSAAEASSPSFTCQAIIDLPGGSVAGPQQRASTKKLARQQAMLALIAHLSGLDLPAPDGGAPSAPAAPRMVEEIPRGPIAVTLWEGLSREKFSAALRDLLSAGAPTPGLLEELEERTHACRVSPKDWWLLLTQGGGAAWNPARGLAVRVAYQVPGVAANIMNLIRQQSGTGPVTYAESRHGLAHSPEFEVTASLATDAGSVSGRPQRGRAKKDAQDRALASLLAVMAGMPDPSEESGELSADLPKALRQPASKNPLAALSQATNSGLITAPEYDYDTLNGTRRCRARVLMDGQLVEAVSRGTTKAEARNGAANRLLARLRSTYLAPEGSTPPLPVPAPRTAAPAAESGTPHWQSAAQALSWAVGTGCALLFHPAFPGRLLLYRPDGAPVHDSAPPAPLTVAGADVVLLGDTHKVWRTSVQAWAAPVPLLLPLLTADAPAVHPSVSGWATVARLALHVVAARAIVPAIGDAGHDIWRPIPGADLDTALHRAAATLPPYAHAATAGANPLRIHPALPAAGAVLGDLVAALVRSPAGELLHGGGAYAAPPAVQDVQVQGWADGIERDLDPLPEPALQLTVQAPGPSGPLMRDGEPVLPARLTACDDEQASGVPVKGRGARRVLRRGAAVWPPLARLAHAPAPEVIELSAAEAAELLGDAGPVLADAGVRLAWPSQLADALGSYTVLGSGSARTSGRELTMEAMLDWRWQLTVNGQDLTEEEMDALAEAARPLVRLRGRWILADPLTLARARARHLGQLPAREALTSALAGSLIVNGTLVPCRPAGGLATLVTALRSGHTASPAVPPPAGLTATLRPYQQRALQWLVQLSSLRLNPLLADDMGLGKTVVTLAYALHRLPAAEGPVMVVCPTSLVDTWQREAAKFTPELRVVRHHGAGRRLDPALTAGTMVVTTYGTLIRDAAQLAEPPWDLVVADEAHMINSGTSQAAVAIRTLTSQDRLAITGTPVENRSEEMWALQDWLNPGLLGSRRAFRQLIGRHTERDADGDAAQLLKRLTGPFVLRRLKSDPEIAPDLPEKIQMLHPVTLSTEQAALYEALVRETMEDLKSRPGAARARRVLALLQDLRKIVNDPAIYLGERVEEAAADLASARRRSAKLDELLDLMADARAGDEQTIICVNYLPVGQLLTAYLAAAGHRAEFFQGSTLPKARTRMVDDFQAGRLPVIILSVRAGGVGLTLTAATQVIHYDSPWTSTALEQASDRAFRIGQTRTVHVRRLVARGTVEERIERVITHKSTLADAVLPAGESIFADMDDQDLTALVTLGSRI